MKMPDLKDNQELDALRKSGFTIEGLVDEEGGGGDEGGAGGGGDEGGAGGGGDEGGAGGGGDEGGAGGGDEGGITDEMRDQMRADFVKDIFGEEYQTYDQVKGAEISKTLAEVKTLRESNTQMKSTLEGRPLGYANENIALFNEFVKKTKIENYGAFNKVMNTDIEKLDDIDIMVLKEVIDKPSFIGQETLLKQKFIKQYNISDDADISDDDRALNNISLKSDALTARKSIIELKDGVKLPDEKPGDDSGLTDEQKTALDTGWGQLNKEMGVNWKTLPIIPSGSKTPLLNYEIPADVKQNLLNQSKSFCVENQLELNEKNVREVFSMMQRDLIVDKLPDIITLVADKVKGMTAEEYDKLYANPSNARNTDAPDDQGGVQGKDTGADALYSAEKKYMTGEDQ